MNLITHRLRLRPFQAADINDTYIGWLNDPEVTRFSNQRFSRHSLASCSNYWASFNFSNNSFLLIERLEDSLPIGTATIYRNLNHGTADVGLMLGRKSCWGKGYGKEAWQSLLSSIAQESAIRKITGGAVRPNVGMVRIMELSGMRLEAVRLRHELVDQQEVDILLYSMFVSP